MLEQDVVDPWPGNEMRRLRVVFTPTGKKTRTLPIAASLDGEIAVTASFATGGSYDVDLLGPNGKVLARGLWSGRSQKRLTHTICGERPLAVRLVRRGSPGTVVVRTSAP